MKRTQYLVLGLMAMFLVACETAPRTITKPGEIVVEDEVTKTEKTPSESVDRTTTSKRTVRFKNDENAQGGMKGHVGGIDGMGDVTWGSGGSRKVELSKKFAGTGGWAIGSILLGAAMLIGGRWFPIIPLQGSLLFISGGILLMFIVPVLEAMTPMFAVAIAYGIPLAILFPGLFDNIKSHLAVKKALYTEVPTDPAPTRRV